MTSDRVPPREMTEDERARVVLDDPEVQARLRQIHEDIESGQLGAGIRSEDLRRFLREQHD